MASRPFFFPTKQREAIRRSLFDHGVATPAIAVRRMERHVRRYRDDVAGKQETTLESADQIYKILSLSSDLFEELLEDSWCISSGVKDSRGLQMLARKIGAAQPIEDQTVVGEHALMSCVVSAENLRSESVDIADFLERKFWDEPTTVDRCLLRLSRRIGAEWREATHRRLPLFEGGHVDRDVWWWDPKSVIFHPLWAAIQSIGLRLSAPSVQRLVKYTHEHD